MILTIEEALMLVPEAEDCSEEELEFLLSGIEDLVRTICRSRFQDLRVRFAAESLDGKLLGTHPGLDVGDTLELSGGNQGLYLVEQVTADAVTLSPAPEDAPMNLATRVEYPDGVKEAAAELLGEQLSARNHRGISSETVSRWSVTYDREARDRMLDALRPWRRMAI